MRRNFKLFPVETENKNSGFSCSTWIGLRPLQFATIYANSVVEPAIASHKNPFRTICKIEEKRYYGKNSHAAVEQHCTGQNIILVF